MLRLQHAVGCVRIRTAQVLYQHSQQGIAPEASLSGYSTSAADDKSAGGVHPHLPDKQKTSDFTRQHEEPTGSQKIADKAAGHKGEDVDQRIAPAQDQGEGDSNVPQGGTGKKPKKDHIPGVDIGSGQSPD